MNPFKVFGAGLSSWGSYVTNNRKKVLLWILLAPIAYIFFCAFIAVLGYGMFRGLMWLVMHTPKSVNDFINVHHVGVAYSMLGFVVLYTICFSLYQDGKKKLLQKLNDKVPSI
jgi:hypothetical protein